MKRHYGKKYGETIVEGNPFSEEIRVLRRKVRTACLAETIGPHFKHIIWINGSAFVMKEEVK
jgi:hypothetical protein